MRDPHVTLVRYEVYSDEGVSYQNPPPVTFSVDIGDFNLVDGQLEVKPAHHYTSGEQAHRGIEPFLKAWEIETDLARNRGEIRFKFLDADVVDRNPPPPGSPYVLECEAGAMGIAFCDFKSEVVRTSYPPPPSGFVFCDELGILYQRWNDFRDGKERLQSMAVVDAHRLDTCTSC